MRLLTNGNHTIYVHAKDAAGNWGATSTATLVIDKTAPTIVSINRVDANPTSAASVQFLVTFSEAVTGVNERQLCLCSGGSVSGRRPGHSGDRQRRDPDGHDHHRYRRRWHLGLNLTSATGITDIAGNACPRPGLPFVGQVYTQPTPPLYFSTSGNTNPPGVGGTADDADIYFWNGTAAFSRSIDASGIRKPRPARRRQRRWLRPGGRHPLLHVVQRYGDRAGHRHRAG